MQAADRRAGVRHRRRRRRQQQLWIIGLHQLRINSYPIEGRAGGPHAAQSSDTDDGAVGGRRLVDDVGNSIGGGTDILRLARRRAVGESDLQGKEGGAICPISRAGRQGGGTRTLKILLRMPNGDNV